MGEVVRHSDSRLGEIVVLDSNFGLDGGVAVLHFKLGLGMTVLNFRLGLGVAVLNFGLCQRVNFVYFGWVKDWPFWTLRWWQDPQTLQHSAMIPGLEAAVLSAEAWSTLAELPLLGMDYGC